MITYTTKKSIKMFLIKALHFIVSVGLFILFFIFFRYGRLTDLESWNFRYNYYVMIAYAVFLLFFNRTYNSYLFGFLRIRAMVFGQILSQGFSLTILYIAVSVAWNHLNNPLIFLPLLVIQFFLDVCLSYYGNALYYKLHGKRRTLLIYRNQYDKRRFGFVSGKPIEYMYEITDEMQYDGKFIEIKEKLAGYGAIFVAGVNSTCRNGILKYCMEENIPGFFLPHVGDVIMQSATHVQALDAPVLYVNRKHMEPEYALVKRAFDIVSSFVAIVILAPLLLIIGFAIKLYDRGPVLYKQTRLTKDGKEFEILKFRSMRVNAEKDGVARLSTGENDDRITPVGKIIRRYRIDELPQLVNILRGDMSVVGPRPERPEIAELYYKKMPDFKLRLQVKAGLTGYAQVYGKYNTDPYEKLEFDLLYINSMNIVTDLKLCFATFAILFNKDSTEGVKVGNTNGLEGRDD